VTAAAPQGGQQQAAPGMPAGYGPNGHADRSAPADDLPAGFPTYAHPSNPMAVARQVVRMLYSAPDPRGICPSVYTLVWWKGDFYAYTGTHWQNADDPEISGQLYRLLEHAVYYDGKDKQGKAKWAKWAPSQARIGSLTDALAKGVVQLTRQNDPPTWISGVSADTDLLPVSNGLLSRPGRVLYRHDSWFFSTWSLPYAYDSRAPRPRRWLEFLASCWPEDTRPAALLQEWFGYVLSGDTSLQKIMLLYGPRRSGKGTITRVMRELIGTANTASPPLAGLAREFGMEGLIGKPLITIPDARLGRADSPVIVERLLSVSGEDALSVPRKYKKDWDGKLPGRIMILTNELPRLDDLSGALPSRFLPLIFTKSWLGEEDPDLTRDLLGELPGILNWALDGLDRLRRNRRFTEPGEAAELLAELERLTSPVKAFIADCLDTGPAYTEKPEAVFAAWQCWCARQGRDRPGTAEVLGRDLRAALPGLSVTRPRDPVTGKQQRTYAGIRIRPPGPETR
jgi:putative DNA primase/helicase